MAWGRRLTPCVAGGFVRDREATQAHVRHAAGLFKVSTMDAVRSGIMDHLVRRPSPWHGGRRLNPMRGWGIC